MKNISALLLLLSTVLTTTALNAAEKPNFVFIIADDCTYHDLGTYGGQAKTPNLDQLASQGMKFMNCFQAAPMCSPTRHNIYTGIYPVKSGAYPNHTFAKDGTKSIVHHLKPLGYRLALSGKTHISPRTVFPFEYSGKGNPDMARVGTLMSECAESKTPFCLFACSNEPHTPWNKGDASQYPPEKIKLPPYIAETPVVREAFSRYLAEITYFDGQVGQIVDLLDKHKLADNTMVMVVSEQGNAFPFAKWTCYDMGLHSGMVVRWPGRVKPGSIAKALVEYCDITPTFVDAAGGKASPEFDGKSFLTVLEGKTNQHKQYAYGIHTTRGIINGSSCFPIRSIRSDKYHLIWNLSYKTKFTNACTKHETFISMLEAAQAGDERAKTVTTRYQHRPEWELFDVQADPLQQKNLFGDDSLKEVTTTLQNELRNWMASQGDRGIETELEARDHQGRARKKKPKKPKN